MQQNKMPIAQGWLYAALILLLALPFAADLIFPLGTAVWVVYLLPVVLAYVSREPRVPPIVAAAATLLTIVGLQVNRLFSGAVVIEAVFAIPGAGQLVAYSAINKDFPVVQGVVLVLVIMVILVNLFVDIINGLLDPRAAA